MFLHVCVNVHVCVMRELRYERMGIKSATFYWAAVHHQWSLLPHLLLHSHTRITSLELSSAPSNFVPFKLAHTPSNLAKEAELRIALSKVTPSCKERGAHTPKSERVSTFLAMNTFGAGDQPPMAASIERWAWACMWAHALPRPMLLTRFAPSNCDPYPFTSSCREMERKDFVKRVCRWRALGACLQHDPVLYSRAKML